jgi:hypothetical protein
VLGHTGYLCHLGFIDSRAIVTRCIFRAGATDDLAIGLATNDNPNAYVLFVGNLIENHVSSYSTGTLIVSAGFYGEIAYNVIRNTDNNLGSAIQFQGGYIRTHHNYFEGNITHDPAYPSVIKSTFYGRPTLDSNLFVHNSGPTIDYWNSYHVTLDARNNYWGDPSGPYHPTLNPFGQGDTILSDSVLFIPWLTSPPDTTMPNAVGARRPEISSTWRIAAIYPNPFNSEIRMEIAGFTGNDFRLSLYNLLGQEVAEIHSGALTGGTLHYQAPSVLASGVYLVRAADRLSVKSAKVVFLK